MIFDQVQRYKTIEIIINIARSELRKRRFTILEIGANEERNLEKVLPDDEIQYSDIVLTEQMESDSKFIQVDGCNMPEISNGQFDFVVALDVFEHVPDEKRENFMMEVSRVAKHMAIVCFPYKSVYNESAEKRVNAYYKMIFGNDHKWLLEHIQNGLPKINCVADMLTKNQISHQEFYHGDIFLWEEMMKALFTVYDLQNGGYYFEELDKLYEEQMYYSDQSDCSYRVFIMLSENENLLQNVVDVLKKMYTNKQSEKVGRLALRCIDDIKYRLISEQGRKSEIKSQVYYTFDGIFCEQQKWMFVSEGLDANAFCLDQRVELDKKYKALRFDPIEGENCIVKNFIIESDTGEVGFEVLNGTCAGNRIIFCVEDPQIYIDLSGMEKIKWINIHAEILRTKFPEAVIRYPINQKIDNSVESLLKYINRNGESIVAIENEIHEYIKKQNEIYSNMNKCDELLSERTKQCNELQSQLIEVRKREEEIGREKNYWEARCSKMESTISWRLTGILRKLGKIFQ